METVEINPLEPSSDLPTTNRSGGRPKGQVNRSTSNARKAIAKFVDAASPHLLEWLSQVAGGIPRTNAVGEVLRDNQGATQWVNKPDPGAAIKATADLLEYHIPRLSRSEQSAVIKIEQGELDISTMTTEDLKRFVLRRAGVDSLDALTLDAESVLVPAEPTPDWLEPK